MVNIWIQNKCGNIFINFINYDLLDIRKQNTKMFTQ